MEPRLALLARPGPHLERYLSAREGLAQVDSAATVAQFLELLRRRAYQGLLIDIPTQIKASDSQAVKDELAVILRRFPTARLNWRPDGGAVSVLVLGASTAGDYTLSDFIENQCAQFHGAPARSNQRIELHLHLLLHRAPPGGAEAGQPTVTHNLSPGGCFIITGDPWDLGARAWITLPELPAMGAIQVEVRWAQPWGQTRRLPGIGVRFLDLGPEQAQQIAGLLGL
ncbi:MAG: PilZ domain-containing protein [Desulfarculus sp.]|nr:PilZ domain-containing protein [Desulfarculus sp.]